MRWHGIPHPVVVGSDVEEQQPNQKHGVVDVYRGGPGWKLDPLHPDQRLGPEILPLAGDEYGMRWNVNVLDVDNDSIADLFIIDHDRGFLYRGSASGFHTYPDRVFLPPDTNWFRFLRRAFRIGDIDGDGYNDFATNFRSNGTNPGYVIFGGYPWERTGVEETPVRQALDVHVYPNPFRDMTTISLGNLSEAVEEGMILDVLGRVVRRVPLHRDGVSVRMYWDGLDAAGNPAPSGMYYFSVTTEHSVKKGSIVKMK